MLLPKVGGDELLKLRQRGHCVRFAGRADEGGIDFGPQGGQHLVQSDRIVLARGSEHRPEVRIPQIIKASASGSTDSKN